MKTPLDYKQAGVDVDQADQLVEWLQKSPEVKNPWQKNIVSGIGGFASLFRFPTNLNMKKPLLVSGTDGVGTKVKLAAEFSRYEGVGQDLVAMCVNDVICCGATPLFFLDYYAVGKLNTQAAQAFLTSVRNACEQAEMALVGGETAEMPGVYQANDFDCAGFVVGVVDEEDMYGPHKVKEGDVLLAIESSGFHSNGYSLLRKVFAEDLKEWAERLLIPTHIYVKLVKAFKATSLDIHALAHITGGGFENVPRVLPQGVSAELKAWPLPTGFAEVARRTGLSHTEMLKTLNCGVGLVVVLPAKDVAAATKTAKEIGLKAFEIGRVVANGKGEPEVIYPHGLKSRCFFYLWPRF